jgi:hypothetical protein
MLLRNGLEAACLRFQEPLELLARAVCDFDRVEQRFVWDGATRTLRYARDTSQCVDYFTSLRDFGVWSCFDAANDEFFYDAPAARYCLLLDHDKCVRTVTGEATVMTAMGTRRVVLGGRVGEVPGDRPLRQTEPDGVFICEWGLSPKP